MPSMSLSTQENPQEEPLLVTTETGVDIGDCCCIAESPQVALEIERSNTDFLLK